MLYFLFWYKPCYIDIPAVNYTGLEIKPPQLAQESCISLRSSLSSKKEMKPLSRSSTTTTPCDNRGEKFWGFQVSSSIPWRVLLFSMDDSSSLVLGKSHRDGYIFFVLRLKIHTHIATGKYFRVIPKSNF